MEPKHRRWVIFFALTVIVYGSAQIWERQRSNDFQASLLDFISKEVSRIVIEPQDAASYQLIDYQDKWLLSSSGINERANEEAITDLLYSLAHLKTRQIITNKPSKWSDYGVADDEGATICLQAKKQADVCIRIGATRSSSKGKGLETYFRLKNQQEVYMCEGLVASHITTDIDSFRNTTLLHLTNPLIACYFKQDTITKQLSSTDLPIDSTLLLEQQYIWESLNTHHKLQGEHFADHIDELNIRNYLNWTVSYVTPQDSLVVYCYRDSSSQEYPFILHSSQFPQTWFKSDSSGIYQKLVQAWTKSTN